MDDSDHDAARAEGKIRLALCRLAAAYPFHAAVLEQFKAAARPEVGTMGVTMAGGDVLLFYSPAFVLETPLPQLGGVLLHEVHHVVLSHVLADPADFPDEWARVVAEEVTVNEYVHEPLPEGAITLADFPSLPLLESTRQRYDRLTKVKRRRPIASGPAPWDDTREGGASGDRPASVGTPAGGQRRVLQTIDNHVVWQEARQDPSCSGQAVRGVIQLAAMAVDDEQIPAQFREAVAAAGVGRSPGDAGEALAGDADGTIDWGRVLRRYVGRVLHVRPTLDRPPRRFPELVGVVPGQSRRAGRPKIMAVLDTSGSITTPLLERISAELAGLARRYRVIVVECDAAVQLVYRYRPVLKVHGRGGTDLRPPLERKFLARQRPDLIIYFTDGEGPAPARPPAPPVVWCLTPGSTRPAPWGHVIAMNGTENTPPGTKSRGKMPGKRAV